MWEMLYFGMTLRISLPLTLTANSYIFSALTAIDNVGILFESKDFSLAGDILNVVYQSGPSERGSDRPEMLCS